MRYSFYTTKKFDKAFKKCIKRGLNPQLFEKVVKSLIETGAAPPECHPHMLHGTYEGYWECHIKGDWLLIWQQNDTELTLLMIDTGSHSDLFG